MVNLDTLRFVFITGKGGVGKTTVTAALGRALAERGQRVLIAGCSSCHSLARLVGSSRILPTISPAAPGVWTLGLSPDVAFREYAQMILKSQRLNDAIFGNRYVSSFLDAVPGLKEWAMLGKAWYHSIEAEQGRPRFDVVLLDAPATGHGLEMLRVPRIIIETAPSGVLRRDAERAWSMFQDPAQTGVVVVTLPEEMPTNETEELVESLRDELSLSVALIAVNGVIEQLFVEREREALLSAQALRPTDPIVNSGARRSTRERIQTESIARLVRLGVPILELPALYREAASPAGTARLSRAFLDLMAAGGAPPMKQAPA
jgi:anion-transporting  ArsA/GET3 family ATPase